jgi:hypothetical protein
MIGRDREAEILRLYHAEKWPIGTVAEQLGVHHSTVRRVLAQAGLDAGRVSARPSMVDPYAPFIVETLMKHDFMEWLMANIDDHLAAAGM